MQSAPTIPGLSCPSCGEAGTLHLRLEDGVVICNECEEEFDRDSIEATANAWARLLTWIKNTSPPIDP
jgi:transposase